LLRVSLIWDALPDSMMLASSSGLPGRRARKRASLKQVHALNPTAASMLGAGQRDYLNPSSNTELKFVTGLMVAIPSNVGPTPVSNQIRPYAIVPLIRTGGE
jgi:hypothetical protein